MEPVFVQTWLLGPLLMLAVALGCGLLVRRVASGAVPAVLVLPVGYAVAVTTAALLTAFDLTAELAGPAFCLLALVGLVRERRLFGALWARRANWISYAAWPALAAFVAFSVVAAPVVLTGDVTYTGYARITDIAHQFDFTRWLVTEGRSHPPTRDFSYAEVVTKTLDIGYPAGGQTALGSFARLLGVDIPWFWQVFMAVNAAMLALALYGLLGRAIDNRALRAIGAAIAAQPNILYGYALVGGIKEFTSAAFLVLSAALVPTLLARPARPLRELLPLAVAVSAAVAAFSLTIVPWLGVIAAGVVVLALLHRDRWAALGRIAALAVAALALAGPTVYLAMTKLLPVVGMAEGSGATVLNDLGNLAAPVPVRAVTGIWISADYRFPAIGDRPATNILIVLALLLVAAGAVRVVRRRDWPLALVGASVALAVVYFVVRTGPWLEFKGLTTSAPVVLAFAFVGASALADGASRLLRRRAAAATGWVAALAVALGVLVGNAYAYHEFTLAPSDRLRELERLGRELDGGPALLPAWEEAAEYFLRDQRLSARPNGFLQIRPEVPPEQVFAYDTDEVALPYLQAHELLVVRQGPFVSRPPSNYRLERRTRFYEVWRRVAPASTVVEHVGAPGAVAGAVRTACRTLVERAAEGRSGERLAYVLDKDVVPAPLGAATNYSANWQIATDNALLMYGRGQAEVRVDLPAGRFDVWLAGPVSREVAVALDGRRIGAVSDAWSYPSGWSLVGTASTSRSGRYVVRVTRLGGNLEPGDGAKDQPIGPVVFAPQQSDPSGVRFAPLEEAASLCASIRDLDWVEIVRGEAQGADATTRR